MAHEWFARDFDHPLYFEIYRDKEVDAAREGPGLAALMQLPEGSLVLDLPCGWGRLRPGLEGQGFRIVGGDLSALNLEKHGREHPGHLLRLDLRSLPFRTGMADGIFCAFTSWGYFATDEENLQQLLEFARVLKRGGVLLLDLVGRRQLEASIAPLENRWLSMDTYRERVRWSTDRRRVLTDRIMDGVRFRHDIWVPEDTEIQAFLVAAGFRNIERFGDPEGGPWHPEAERWIYRATL
jgi:SAM-dependent methyltransferase